MKLFSNNTLSTLWCHGNKDAKLNDLATRTIVTHVIRYHAMQPDEDDYAGLMHGRWPNLRTAFSIEGADKIKRYKSHHPKIYDGVDKQYAFSRKYARHCRTFQESIIVQNERRSATGIRANRHTFQTARTFSPVSLYSITSRT